MRVSRGRCPAAPHAMMCAAGNGPRACRGPAAGSANKHGALSGSARGGLARGGGLELEIACRASSSKATARLIMGSALLGAPKEFVVSKRR